MTSTKPYDISKRRVLEAYRHVRANRGAAGIDDESIEMFEADLSRNLYKLWNRIASGSYFPPPVKQVEIPKKQGRRVLAETVPMRAYVTGGCTPSAGADGGTGRRCAGVRAAGTRFFSSLRRNRMWSNQNELPH
jgi:hypothetical protein